MPPCQAELTTLNGWYVFWWVVGVVTGRRRAPLLPPPPFPAQPFHAGYHEREHCKQLLNSSSLAISE